MKRLKKCGFLMVELAVALVLLSSTIIIMSSWYGQATRERSRALKQLHALHVARSALDRCLAHHRVPPSPSFDEGVTLTWHLMPDTTLVPYTFVKICAVFEGEEVCVHSGIPF